MSTMLGNRPLKPQDFVNKTEWHKYWYTIMGLTRGIGLVTGPPRSGKTLWATLHAKKLRNLFGREVVLDYDVHPEFGPYTKFDENVLLEELETVTKIAKDAKLKKGVRTGWEHEAADKLKLYGKTIVFDEGYKYFHNRRTMNTLGILLVDMMRQYGHYDILMLIISPYEDELDAKGPQRYATFQVKCNWGLFVPDTGFYDIYNRQLMQSAQQTIYGPNHYNLWDSFNPIAARGHVNIKL